MTAPYPISAGILPALPEYHCHCSPVWMRPDLRRGEECPRIAKSPLPTGPPQTAAFAPPRPLTLRDGSGSSCPITAIVYGQSRRLQWRESSHSFLARCVEGSTARVLQHAHPLATQAHLRQIGMDYLDQLLGGIHLA